MAIVAGLAGAADAETPWAIGISTEHQSEARRLHRLGNLAFERGELVAALSLYDQALAEWDHPAIRFNLAETYIQLGQPYDAYDNVVLALRHGEDPLGPELFATAAAYRDELGASMARVIFTAEQPCRIELDGELVLEGPGAVERVMRPGMYEVIATMPAHRTELVSLELGPGDENRVTIALDSMEGRPGLFDERSRRVIDHPFTLPTGLHQLSMRATSIRVEADDDAGHDYGVPLPLWVEWSPWSKWTIESLLFLPTGLRYQPIATDSHDLALRAGLDLGAEERWVFGASFELLYQLRLLDRFAVRASVSRGLAILAGEGGFAHAELEPIAQLTDEIAVSASVGASWLDNGSFSSLIAGVPVQGEEKATTIPVTGTLWVDLHRHLRGSVRARYEEYPTGARAYSVHLRANVYW
jgi:hypothetical protein